MLLIIYDPCVIVIERRETLKEVAKKSQTYTDIINELISSKEKSRIV
jgi:hypothetical protein